MFHKSKYEKLTKPYQEDLINSLTGLVKIKSVKDSFTIDKENPFGKGVTAALEYVENLAKNDGFAVSNYENKVVEITVGEGEKNIAILAHADIVPEGTGWDHDPFDMYEKKGILHGRGVADDKGPLLASYYALKALRDNNLLGNYQVRFVVGGDEESGSSCLEHYFHILKKPQPTFAFSPDADFPIIYAEKGIFDFEIKKKISVPGFIAIAGGVASNSVIEKCILKMELNGDFINFIKNKYNGKNVEIETKDDIANIIFTGVAAHGAAPELGKNAGLEALSALAEYSKDEDFISFINRIKPLDASGINAGANDEELGHNTLNIGLISSDGNEVAIICNYRYINTCEEDEQKEKIKKALSDAKVKFLGGAPKLFFSKDSALVKTLVGVYQEETGDKKTKPLAIGGGTYAKECDNCVAFGMEFPGWNSNMHSPGEAVRKKDLFKAMSIYAHAIIELGNKLDEN